MDITIREATQADYPALCAVFAEVHALHCAALSQIFRQPATPALPEEYVAETIADPGAALLVAEQDNHVVGLLIVKLQEAPNLPIFVPRRYAIIHNLAVRSERRRAGIGRALMARAHRWARDQGVSEVELSVWEFNTTALAFYEQLGYATMSRKMSISLT
jgi:ribosomal protein S18 acetylase RimI-like enzyme